MTYNLRKHEIMHAASMLMADFESHCLERVDPKDGDVKLKPKALKLAQKAHQALFDFYQAMGEETLVGPPLSLPEAADPDVNWAKNQRLIFIRKTLTEEGRINRKDITDKFKISLQQAAADLSYLQRKEPKLMHYDRSYKCYRYKGTK